MPCAYVAHSDLESLAAAILVVSIRRRIAAVIVMVIVVVIVLTFSVETVENFAVQAFQVLSIGYKSSFWRQVAANRCRS